MIANVVFGFLGAGKTTFIKRVLKEWGDRERIVVLVNEFGEVGIDGTLLQGQGGNVVEMPSGCICCTLQADFRSQILDIIETIQPQLMIIEPTGVATISQIRAILEAQLFEEAIEIIHYILVADAAGFLGLYKANAHFVESQVKSAHAVILNKCDRVERKRAILTRDALYSINPDTTVLMTEYGAVDWGEYKMALSASRNSMAFLKDASGKASEEYRFREQDSRSPFIHVHEDRDVLGYESFGLVYEGERRFDHMRLLDLFSRLSSGELGDVARAKGIFHAGDQWILIELASGEISSQPISPSKETKVAVIGKHLNGEKLKSAVEECFLGGIDSIQKL